MRREEEEENGGKDKFQEIKLWLHNLQLKSAGSKIKNREEYIKGTLIKNLLMHVWIVGSRCEIENAEKMRGSDLIKKHNLWHRNGGGE